MPDIRVQQIIFTGKQNIDWHKVEKYLGKYIGKTYTVKETGDIIQLNYGFVDEFTSSKYTLHLRGALAKVKANISQVIPELICSAGNRRWLENKELKHEGDANGGWYRYDVVFSIPVKAENEVEVRYNQYKGTMVVKINNRGLFLYDVINIKKKQVTRDNH